MAAITDLTGVYRRNAAHELGTEHGRARGSWVLDGNSTVETARAILEGIADGDPLVLDELPLTPDLSGEWSDEPSGPEVYREICERASDWADRDGATVREYDPANQDDFADVLDVYSDAFASAAQEEIVRAARAVAGDERGV